MSVMQLESTLDTLFDLEVDVEWDHLGRPLNGVPSQGPTNDESCFSQAPTAGPSCGGSGKPCICAW